MSGVATAVAAAATAGAGVYAANKAAGAQKDAAKRASNTELEQYYQSREDLAPWRDVGGEAIRKAQEVIEQGPQDYTESPGYNFLIDESNKALARSQSARGILDSGQALREAERYGQNLAKTEYQNYLTNWLNTKVNPLLALSGTGQVAAQQTANNAMAAGNVIGNLQAAQGNATASGYINSTNAITGGINAGMQGINNYMFSNYLKGLNQQQSPQTQPASNYAPPVNQPIYYGTNV